MLRQKIRRGRPSGLMGFSRKKAFPKTKLKPLAKACL
jgi:hypothetical protein